MQILNSSEIEKNFLIEVLNRPKDEVASMNRNDRYDLIVANLDEFNNYHNKIIKEA